MSFLSSVMKTVRERVLDDGSLPRSNEVTDQWYPPQFSKLHDSSVRVTRVAMFIASRDPLFSSEHPSRSAILDIARELDRIVQSKWANREASTAANVFTSDKPTSFVAILEHAPIGAYGARTQQIKAFYEFSEDRIGALEPKGLLFEEEQVNECVTI